MSRHHHFAFCSFSCKLRSHIFVLLFQIVENLRAANKDVSLADPASLIPQVLHKFYSSRVHDPTFERKMYQHLHQHDEL